MFEIKSTDDTIILKIKDMALFCDNNETQTLHNQLEPHEKITIYFKNGPVKLTEEMWRGLCNFLSNPTNHCKPLFRPWSL